MLLIAVTLFSFRFICSFVWFYLFVTSSLVLSVFHSCVTEAEEHRWSSGLLDGQRFGTAELHQAGQRSQPHHAGRAGPARSPGSDGFQVSVLTVYSNQTLHHKA